MLLEASSVMPVIEKLLIKTLVNETLVNETLVDKWVKAGPDTTGVVLICNK